MILGKRYTRREKIVAGQPSNKRTRIYDENFRKLLNASKEWLEKYTKSFGEHVLIGEGKFIHSIAIPSIKLRALHAYRLVTHGDFLDENYKLKRSKLCGEPRCLSHFWKVQTNAQFEEFEYEDYQYMSEYLDSMCDKEGECLLWSKTIDADGYGLSHLGKSAFREQRVHRIAWQIWHGRKIPELQNIIRHRCGNRNCIAKHHLEIGTDFDNAADRKADGKQLKGEQISTASIDQKTARLIMDSIGSGTQQERADRFGVQKSLVAQIDSGKNWRYLRTPEEIKIIDEKEKRILVRLDRRTVKAIKWSKWAMSPVESARTYKVRLDTVYSILNNKTHVKVNPNDDSDDDERSKKDEYYSQLRKRIRINSDVVKDEDGREHWLFQGKTNKNGYGSIYFYHRNRPVHYVSWIVFKNLNETDLPENSVIRHGCRYKNCVYVGCLRGPGSMKDNANDRKLDGTTLEGEKNPLAKLTNQQAREIRDNTQDSGVTLAKKYGVGPGVINTIRRGETYKNV